MSSASTTHVPVRGANGAGAATVPSPFERATPMLFVGIWATGFIVARLVAPFAEPLTFLTVRFIITSIAFAGLAVVVGAPWPRTYTAWRNAIVSGLLMQAIYLGGIFWATRHGMPAAVAALITGLQPLLTAALAFPLLGEQVGLRRWGGIVLGFAGAVLVLLPSFAATVGVAALTPLPVLACVTAMVSMTFGTLWQKRFGMGVDLRTHACVQFAGSATLLAPIALLAEGFRIDLHWQVLVGLSWAVLGLSIGAATLLLLLIKRGAVAGVASLFYLVPPVVAVIAFFLFGEQLAVVQIIGMALAAAGVGVASRP